MKINDVITEATGNRTDFSNPQLGAMGKFGKGLLGVASALGSNKANQSLRQINTQQASTQATANAAQDAEKFNRLINIAKNRAVRQGNQISTTELGMLVPKTGQWAAPDSRRQLLTQLGNTLAQQHKITVNGPNRLSPSATPAAQPTATQPTATQSIQPTTPSNYTDPQQVVDMISTLPSNWLPTITAELLKRQQVGANRK